MTNMPITDEMKEIEKELSHVWSHVCFWPQGHVVLDGEFEVDDLRRIEVAMRRSLIDTQTEEAK